MAEIDRQSIIVEIQSNIQDLEKGVAEAKKLIATVTDVQKKTNKAVDEGGKSFDKIKDKANEAGEQIASSLGPVGGILLRITKGALGFVGAIRTAAVATRAFGLALIATGIGAIVVAVGALAAAFLSTAKGADAVTRVVEPLKAIFSAFLGVAQKLGTQMVEAFKNPKKLVIDLGKLILDNLINRVKGFAVVLKNLADFNFQGVADGFIQIASGVEGATGKIIALGKEAGKIASEAAKNGKRIADINIEIGDLEKKRSLALAEITAEQIKQEEILKDSEDKSAAGFAKRRAASQELLRLKEAEIKVEQDFLALELEREKLKAQIQLTSFPDSEIENQKEINDIIALQLTNETKIGQERIRQQSTLKQINRDQKAAADEAEKRRQAALKAERDSDPFNKPLEKALTGTLINLERQISSLQNELQKAIVSGNEKAVDEAISAIKQVELEILKFKVGIGDKSAVEQFLEIRADRKAKIESDIQATFARISATIAAADEKRIAESKAASDKEAQDKLDNIAKIKAAATGAIDSLAQLNQAQVDQLNNALQFQSERVSRFEELAKTGSARQVIIEEERLQKLEEARAKAVEKQKRLADAQILINQAITISEAVKSIAIAFGTAGPLGIIAGIATSAALGIALASAASSVSGLFGSLPAFAKGTEVLNGKGTGTSDSILARLSKGERVTDAATNKKVNSVARGVFPNKLLPDAVRAYMSTPEIGAAMAGLASTTERGFRELLEEQKQTRIALQRLKVTTAVKNGEIATIVSSYNRGESWRRI